MDKEGIRSLTCNVADFMLGKKIEISSFKKFYSIKKTIKGLMGCAPNLEQIKADVAQSIPDLSEQLVEGIAEGFLIRRQDLQNYYLEWRYYEYLN